MTGIELIGLARISDREHQNTQIARESSIVLLPDGSTEAASLVTQAMAIINKMNKE